MPPSSPGRPGGTLTDVIGMPSMSRRRCQKAGCQGLAVATLTYVYADSQAVLGPLAVRAEPGCYDLCAAHTHSLSAPRGWEVIRLPMEPDAPSGLASDDLLALADAVREDAGRDEPAAERLREDAAAERLPDNVIQLAQRGHLTVVADRPDRAPGR